MKRRLILGVTLLAILAVPAWLAAKGDAAAGKLVYDKKCATCHGAAGEGKDAIAKMMKVELRPLGSKEVQAKKDDELGKAVNEGTGKMKPVKGLTDVELANLLAYLRTLKK